MAFTDYYTTLGIPRTATADEVRKAYRSLARKLHPDLNPDDAAAKQKFQQINEAHEVLSDPEKRARYDKYGEHWEHGEQYEQARRQQQQHQQQQYGGGGFGGGGFSGSDFGDGDYSSIFESMFGGAGGGRPSAFRGQDISAALTIPLRQAATTHQQSFRIGEKDVRITIHAGVENGQKIKLKGYGGPGAQGGPAGDLFITFTVPDEPPFRRDGSDLHTDATIDLYTAVLGGDITVPTLDGSVKLKVKEGTQPGEKVRLKGKGFPVYRKEGAFGDLYVTFRVALPTALNETQRELFRKLADTAKQ